MKIGNKISLLVVLCLTALAIINVEAGNGLVPVKVNIENKTSDKTILLNLFGKNPNWSGEDDNNLDCEVRGDCRDKYTLNLIEPGQTLKLEEQFADEHIGYRLRYCGDTDMIGSVANYHERDVNQCSANFKMSSGRGVLEAILTPLDKNNL